MERTPRRIRPRPIHPTRREFVAGTGGLLALGIGGQARRTAHAQADGTPSVEATPAGPRSIEHALGVTEFPASPERIVSVSISVTGPLLAVGAPVIGSQGDTAISGDPSGFFPAWASVAQERGVRLLYEGFEPDLEAIVAAQPDAIIGSADDGASVAAEVYDVLSQIAPTALFNMNVGTWQERMVELATAVGRERTAREEVAAFERLEDEVAASIQLPPQPTSLVAVPPGDPNFYLIPPAYSTAQLLSGVGFDIVEPTGWTGETTFVPVSQEVIAREITGRSLFYVELAGAPSLAEMLEQPLWSNIPAVEAGHAYSLPFEVLRPDPYVAPRLLRDLAQRFA